MDNSELLILLDSEPQLKAKVCWKKLGSVSGLFYELPRCAGGRSNARARASQAAGIANQAWSRGVAHALAFELASAVFVCPTPITTDLICVGRLGSL